jgi:hypothetical protein
MWKSKLLPASTVILWVCWTGSVTGTESQDLLQQQIQLLEGRHRLLPPSPEKERLQFQILSLRRQLAREIEQENRLLERQKQQQQRQQEIEQRRQQQEQERQHRNQLTLASLQDLLLLQQEELQRIEEEYEQMKQLYPLGLIPETQWNIVQRRLNVQRERIQRTQTRIQELSQ